MPKPGPLPGSPNERIRDIREAAGLTQLQFLDVLNRSAARLGARPYLQSTLSKLETGAQDVSFDDVAVFAAVDPLHRGKLWLGWGEAVDATRNPARDAEAVARPDPRLDRPVTRAEAAGVKRQAEKAAPRRRKHNG
jgi:transcriptional regulator with XRE-family HTH domain